MSDACVRCKQSLFNLDSKGRCPGCAAYDERFATALTDASAERFPLIDYRG